MTHTPYPTQVFDDVPTADPRWDIALGNIPAIQQIIKFGWTGPVGSSDGPLDVWSGGGDYTGQPVEDPSAAATVDVVSDNIEDDGVALLTGAHTAELFGLNELGIAITEIVTLNGLTPVTSTKRFHRLNRVIIRTAGSTGVNVGEVEVSRTGAPLIVFAQVVPDINQSQVACYTIPADKFGLMTNLWVSLGLQNGNSGSGGTTFRVRPPGGVYSTTRNYYLTDGASTNQNTIPQKLNPLDDIKVRVLNISDNNTYFTAEFDILLVDNI